MVAVDLRHVDLDFAFQGEYLGSLFRGPAVHDWQVSAMQVVAQGKGRFEAVIYGGGFPGEGWNGLEPERFAGARDNDHVRLEGDAYLIEIYRGVATFSFKNGFPAGVINKVERTSPTVGMVPPWGAKVLFDGTNTGSFVNGRITPDGLLMQGTELKDLYRDFTMHVEFLLPYMPNAREQGRANSGVYLLSRYEVQILDSFGLKGDNNECGALYRLRRPDFNICYPPLSWQTFDIVFTAAQFDSKGKKTHHAKITVFHNGVAVHDGVAVTRKTGGGAAEGSELLSTKLQDHHNPVRFRNIWVVDDTKPSDSPFPPYAHHPIWDPYHPAQPTWPFPHVGPWGNTR